MKTPILIIILQISLLLLSHVVSTKPTEKPVQDEEDLEEGLFRDEDNDETVGDAEPVDLGGPPHRVDDVPPSAPRAADWAAQRDVRSARRSPSADTG